MSDRGSQIQPFAVLTFIILLFSLAGGNAGIFTAGGSEDVLPAPAVDSGTDTGYTAPAADDILPPAGGTGGAARGDPSSRAIYLGDYDVVVIAAEFPDKIATASISSINNTVTTKMADYYNEVSYDKFTPTATVANNSWFMMPQNMTFYTANNKANFPIFVKDALEAADPYINYDEFRTSSNRVKLVILVHAGQDEATSGDPNDIWSHMSGINPKLLDNSYVTQYCTVSESSAMGTYVHEFGHLLGLPDLYDNDYSSNGIGVWGLMASGSHLNWGNTPGHMSAWSKIQLGWLSSTLVDSNLINQPIPNVETNQVVYKIPIPVSETSSDEYFLVENRYKTGYDQYLPGSGLVIWHIDDAKYTSYFPNNDETHKMMDVEERSTLQHLDDRSNGNRGDASDVWASDADGFTPTSDPNSKSYSGTDSRFYLENIGSSGTTMYADFIIRHIYFEVSGGSEQYANPGDEHMVSVNITSDRSGNDNIDLTLMGTMNIQWISLETLGVTIANTNDKGVASIKVTIPQFEYPNNFCEFTIIALSTDGTEFESETIKIIVAMYYSFSSEQLTDIVLDPGNAEIKGFKVFNNGNVVDTFTITVESTSGWEIKIWEAGDAQPEIDPYSNRTIDVYIEVPGSATSDDKAEITVKITSSAKSTQLSFYLDITVNKLYGFKLTNPYTKNQYETDPGRTVVFRYVITNTGNTADNIGITVTQSVIAGAGAEEWKYVVYPGSVIDTGIGSSETFSLEIMLPEGALAGEIQRFDIILVSEDGITNETARIELKIKHIYGMTAVLDSYTKSTEPEKKVYFNFKITNTGNGNDSYNISLTSALPDGWLLIYPANDDDTILYGKTVKYSLILIPPALEPAGEYKFTIKAYSLGNGSLESKFMQEVDVEIIHSVTITSITQETLVGGPGNVLNFSIAVENKGNDKETVSLKIGSILHGVALFKPSLLGNPITTLELNAGDTKIIIVQLSLSENIEEDTQGAVLVEGVLSDLSKTDHVPLVYQVKADEIEPPASGGSGGSGSTGLFSGTAGIAILAIIVILLIIIIVALILVTKKRKSDNKQKMQKKAMKVQAAQAQMQQVAQMQQMQAQAYQGAVYTGEAVATVAPPAAEYVAPYEMPAAEQPQMTDGKAEVRFDPQTGQPTPALPESTMNKRFDPQTGEPVQALPESTGNIRFDPHTGKPLEEDAVEAEVVTADVDEIFDFDDDIEE